MPWWSWIVIWIALVALSLLFFVVLGARLFRQFMATAKELGEAGERFSTFPSGTGTSGSADVHVGRVGSDGDDAGDGTGPLAEPGSAVFASPVQMRHDYRASKFARQEARRLRRIQRKTDRGQPQRLRDIEFE
jgi:hypothetical protein